jgi:hypothetical protein
VTRAAHLQRARARSYRPRPAKTLYSYLPTPRREERSVGKQEVTPCFAPGSPTGFNYPGPPVGLQATPGTPT